MPDVRSKHTPESLIRWGLTVLGGLIVLAAAANFFVLLQHVGPGLTGVSYAGLRCHRVVWFGTVLTGPGNAPLAEGWRVVVTPAKDWLGSFGVTNAVRSVSSTSQPFMAMLVPAIIAAAMWWRRWRRVPSGHCARCRYDLRGLGPDTACPECGASPPSRSNSV